MINAIAAVLNWLSKILRITRDIAEPQTKNR